MLGYNFGQHFKTKRLLGPSRSVNVLVKSEDSTLGEP